MRNGWAHKLDVCRRQERLGVHKAVLDSSAGFAVAYKACAWAQRLAKKAGVEFILHPTKGKVVSIETTGANNNNNNNNNNNKRTTIWTADGLGHEGDLVVVAGNDSFTFVPKLWDRHLLTTVRFSRRVDGGPNT